MDDALVVRRREALGDLQRIVDRLARREAAAGKLHAQGFALEQFLDDVGRALVRPDVVDAVMLGWLSAPAAWASCSKRRRRSGSAEKETGRTLIATSRFSRSSRARYTSPIPPAPIGASTS